MRKRWYFMIALIPLGILLLTYAVMLLWNELIPGLFHGPELSYWQTLGVMILAKILFGGFRGKWGKGCGCYCGCGCCGENGRCGSMGGNWKQRLDEKLSKMTPEERDKFKLKFYKKCCGGEWEDERKSENAAGK